MLNNKKKILVAVSGLTPQIITETLFALTQHKNWIPNEIKVLTTLVGKEKIISQLLGENGYFARLCKDYSLPNIDFSEKNILVIDENGSELQDIRTEQQNNVAADLIVRTIYDLCQDENTELHISIAGGRKSMGFYAGYALSLFGRVQDTMSHVLVEEDFEMNREFFYPPRQEHILNTNNGMKDASKAQVMLAEIPFVRMTDNKLQFVFEKQMTFSQAVENTQKMLNGGVKLIFDVKNCVVKISDIAEFKLPEQPFCIYATMAKCHKNGMQTQFLNDDDLTQFSREFIEFYQYHQHELRGDSRTAQDERKNKILDLLYIPKGKNRSEIKRIFDESSSNIAKKLKEVLGEYGKRFAIDSQGKNNAKTYFLNIDPNNIEFIE